jgi:hypothetical protein
MGAGGQCHAPATLPLENTRYSLYRRLGGPQGQSGRMRKISPHWDLIPNLSGLQQVAIPTALSRPTLMQVIIGKTKFCAQPKSCTKLPYFNTHCWPIATTPLYLPGQCLAHGWNPTMIKLVCGSIHFSSGLPENLVAESNRLNLVEVLFNTVNMYLPSVFKTVC